MSVTNVSNQAASAANTATRTAGSDLGKDAFLQLLVAQVSNQDPLNPTSDTEFVAQLAQFSSLEQMQNMNQAMESQQATNMIGKDVTANSALDVTSGELTTTQVYGNVTGTSKINGTNYLVVTDYNTGVQQFVPVSAVGSVSESLSATGTEQYLSVISSWLQQIAANTAATTAVPEEKEEETAAVEGADKAQETPAAEQETQTPAAEQSESTQAQNGQAEQAGSIWD